jgi:acetyltransferase-like isoleucine patch superfamily enzyme
MEITMSSKSPFIHHQALVEANVTIGANTRIWAFAHILSNVCIGENCNICDHTFIESDVIIGNNVTVKCGVYLWTGLIIADNVFIGPNATFTNDMRPRSRQYPTQYPQTFLQHGCSIGANATILPGLAIGEWAMVGAGSVVTKSVPAHALVYGNPARVHASVCQCGQQHAISSGPKINCLCGFVYDFYLD